MSDYAKKCGVGGIFHTDELPAYGITGEETDRLCKSLHTSQNDCVVLVAGSPVQAVCAANQVIRRAEMALSGVPEETRKMLEGGSTAYMRPLPGAARMYPETDVLPVIVEKSALGQDPPPRTTYGTGKAFMHGTSGSTRAWHGNWHFRNGFPSSNGLLAENINPEHRRKDRPRNNERTWQGRGGFERDNGRSRSLQFSSPLNRAKRRKKLSLTS